MPTSVLADKDQSLQQNFSPGEIAPKEGPAQNLDLNNSELPEELQQCLKMLVVKFAGQDKFSRRFEVKEAKRQRYYWRTMQYLLWNSKEQSFQFPFNITNGPAADQQGAEMPRFAYTTNIYQAYGLQIIAVLTQNEPTTRFSPKNPNKNADIRASEVAEDFKEVIQHNNKMSDKQIDVARLLWTDGRVCAHTRYVTDGQKFGYKDEDENNEEDEGVTANVGPKPPELSGGMEEEDLDDESTKPKREPIGQEVISFYGKLEVKVPIVCNELSECSYLQLSREVDETIMKSAFPKQASQIHAGSSGGGEDEYERIARIAVMQGTQVLNQGGDQIQYLVTDQQTWFRPSAFTAEEDEAKRAQLQKLFPDGCYVRYAGDTYCESRNESMDDHWALMHALPGDGMDRNSLGHTLMPVQDQTNDLANIRMETESYGIGDRWVNQEIVDVEAMQEQTSQPGQTFGMKVPPGSSIADNIYREPSATVSADFDQFQQELAGPTAQFLTGAQPALFGGAMADQKTASGYAMARDQAMGRIGLVWRAMKGFYSQIYLQAIRCAAANRTEDIEQQFPSKSGQPKTVSIMIEDLKGDLIAFPDTDETFPESYTQKRSVLMQILPLAATTPEIGAMLSTPDNLAVIKDLIGIEEFDIPGLDSRNKQIAEIEQLLEAEPMENPMIAGNPQTSQAAAQAQQQSALSGEVPTPPMLSTIPVDPIFDDHDAEFKEVKHWMNSVEGLKAKTLNPMGYENVRLHGIAHWDELQKQQAAAAPPPPPPRTQRAAAPPPKPAQQAPAPA